MLGQKEGNLVAVYTRTVKCPPCMPGVKYMYCACVLVNDCIPMAVMLHFTILKGLSKARKVANLRLSLKLRYLAYHTTLQPTLIDKLLN